MPKFFVGEKRRCTLQRTADAMDTYAVIILECWLALFPERSDYYIIPSCDQLDAQITYMSLFPTDSGRIGLCEHQNTHFSPPMEML